jgi:hypothetical protein
MPSSSNKDRTGSGNEPTAHHSGFITAAGGSAIPTLHNHGRAPESTTQPPGGRSQNQRTLAKPNKSNQHNVGKQLEPILKQPPRVTPHSQNKTTTGLGQKEVQPPWLTRYHSNNCHVLPGFAKQNNSSKKTTPLLPPKVGTATSTTRPTPAAKPRTATNNGNKSQTQRLSSHPLGALPPPPKQSAPGIHGDSSATTNTTDPNGGGNAPTVTQGTPHAVTAKATANAVATATAVAAGSAATATATSTAKATTETNPGDNTQNPSTTEPTLPPQPQGLKKPSPAVYNPYTTPKPKSPHGKNNQESHQENFSDLCDDILSSPTESPNPMGQTNLKF